MKGVAVVCLIALMGCATGPPKNVMLPSENQLELRAQQQPHIQDHRRSQLALGKCGASSRHGLQHRREQQGVGDLNRFEDEKRCQCHAQQTEAILLTVLTAAGGRPIIQPTDKEQKMRAGVVVKPLGDGHSTIVRVTFQRLVYTTTGTVSTQEMLGTDQIYTEFFDKLSKAVFLEAHDL